MTLSVRHSEVNYLVALRATTTDGGGSPCFLDSEMIECATEDGKTLRPTTELMCEWDERTLSSISRAWLLRLLDRENKMTWMEWYDNLAKPSWTPSPATIGLIWQILYPVIVVSFGFVFVRAFQGKVPRSLALPFAVNLVANLLFMPIFSGLRNVPMAAVDILIVWATIIWCMLVVWRHYRWVAVAQVPYFVWVSIATVIQLSITAMNWVKP